MDINFAQNWPVFILLGAFITFVIFAFRNSRQQEKKNKEAQHREKDKV
jgi:cbb3-type cytochrome oxidase subunit 3